ncbi:FixH family protein [Erythrobacter sp. NE805]|uniref:FixH family protein n=1 Tax=Erythrobacter sp. NE805 TaxID=3389875 RepID=UPI00396AFEA6
MMRQTSNLTGKHMAAIFVGGFAVVIAVNLTMATMAVESFHGTVVDNSYVASQHYNGWLKQAAASKALGWQAVPHRRASDGRVVVETIAVPAGASITGTAERPLGAREATPLTFSPAGKARWVSDQPLAPGRWQLRMAIRAEGKAWAGESALP